jgi:hypothetical protein
MHIRDMIARWRLARRETLLYTSPCEFTLSLCKESSFGLTDLHKVKLFLSSRGAVVEETFRLDLNQSWEAIDIKTGHSVLIPKGSHHVIRMLLKRPPDQTEENYLVVTIQHEGKLVLAGLREAYWRHWEGHSIPEFRVTIRGMNEKPHPPPQKRP